MAFLSGPQVSAPHHVVRVSLHRTSCTTYIFRRCTYYANICTFIAQGAERNPLLYLPDGMVTSSPVKPRVTAHPYQRSQAPSTRISSPLTCPQFSSGYQTGPIQFMTGSQISQQQCVQYDYPALNAFGLPAAYPSATTYGENYTLSPAQLAQAKAPVLTLPELIEKYNKLQADQALR